MTYLKTIRLACILVALLAVLTTRTARAATIPTSTIQCGQWNVVPGPPILNGVSRLNAVSAVSASDVWAVGDSANFTQTLIEHWNGSQWSVVPSLNPAFYNALYGITALSTQNAWAVGFSGSASGVQQTLIEHWNGSQWSVIPSPNPKNSQNNALLSVSVISATDIWAVGYYGSNLGSPQYTLTEHWNGTSWSIVPSPTIDKKGGASTGLYGVTAISSSDVWAVGYDNVGNLHAVIEHWDGSRWSISSHPNLSTQLRAVTAVTASDVWAVGSAVGAQTLTDHWNGSSWSFVPSPSPQGVDYLVGVAASGASNIWSVGWDDLGRGIRHKTVTEHWDGNSWQLVASVNPGFDNFLLGVAMVSPNQVWAVGSYKIDHQPGLYDPLIEYYC